MAEFDNPTDLRRFHRYHMDLPVTVDWRHAEDRGTAPARVRDISNSGAFLYIDAHFPIPVGANLRFTLHLPPEATIGETAEVRFEGTVLRVHAPREGKVGLAAVIQSYETVEGVVGAPAPSSDTAPVTVHMPPRLRLADVTQKVILAVLFLAMAVFAARYYFKGGGGDPLKRQLTSGNPDATVWVHTRTGTYYCKDSEYYGRVFPGRYTSQREAQNDYHRPANAQPCP